MTLAEKMKIEYPDTSADRIFALIMCGDVLVNGEKITDPKTKIKKDAVINLLEKKYVSRGGIKLKEALSFWNINCKGKIFLDAGSSTGGFTDALLRRGAAGVHAVDVGYNQLSYSLRTNPKVYVHERTNIMNVEILDPEPDAAVADLSFRSIKGAASKIMSLISGDWLIALIKPQFEISGSNRAGFNGVITEKEILFDTVMETAEGILKEGLFVNDAILSPVKGRKGNSEFFFFISSSGSRKNNDIKTRIKDLVFN